MQFETTRADLLAAVDAARRAAAPAAIAQHRPTLAGVRLENDRDTLTVTGTDLDLTIEATVKVAADAGGTVVIPARTLTTCVKALPAGPVNIFYEGVGRFEIIARGGPIYRLAVIDADDWPDLSLDGDPRPTAACEWAALAEAIKRVAIAASTDEARPILTGVCLAARHGGGVELTATDSYRLATAHTADGEGWGAAIPDTDGTPGHALIPATALQALVAVADDEGTASVTITDRAARIRVGPTTVTTRLIEGNYPLMAGPDPIRPGHHRHLRPRGPDRRRQTGRRASGLDRHRHRRATSHPRRRRPDPAGGINRRDRRRRRHRDRRGRRHHRGRAHRRRNRPLPPRRTRSHTRRPGNRQVHRRGETDPRHRRQPRPEPPSRHARENPMSPTLTPDAVAQAVLDRITTDPACLDQQDWISTPRVNTADPDGPCLAGDRVRYSAVWQARDLAAQGVPCGTTCCVAGHAVLAALDAGADLDDRAYISDAAAELLGIACYDIDGDPDAAAGHLFGPSRTTAEVIATLTAIAAGQHPRPDKNRRDP